MNIIQIPSPSFFPGREGYKPKWIIVHGTAGFTTAQDVGVFFQTAGVASNYVVGLDGTIVQCVDEADGAWAEGGVTGPSGTSGDGVHHDAWWDNEPNPNDVCISIEHVKLSTDNSDQLTNAQKVASFALILDICKRQGIPMRAADANGGITGHFSMDPVNRQHCPGPYPWDELWAYLKGAQRMTIPSNWHDDGTRLIAPNGHFFVKGFRDAVTRALEAGEDANALMPLENEVQVSAIELHTSPTSGARQICAGVMWIWTQEKGVMRSALGAEVAKCYNIISTLEQQNKTLQAQIAALKVQPTPPASGAIGESIAPLQAMLANMSLLEQEVTQALDVQKVTTQHVIDKLTGKA